jgi:hypothetical protein
MMCFDLANPPGEDLRSRIAEKMHPTASGEQLDGQRLG